MLYFNKTIAQKQIHILMKMNSKTFKDKHSTLMIRI